MKYLRKNKSEFSLVKLVIIAVVIVLIGLAGWFIYEKNAIATPSTKWVFYNSTYANFSVDFPVKPNVIEPFGENGTCSDQSFPNQLTQYGVRCVIYDGGAKTSSLDDYRQGATGNFQHLDSDSHKYTKIDGYSAETFEMTGTGELSSTGINYKGDLVGESLLSGKYIYSLYTLKLGNSFEQAPYTKYFFNSFRIK